MLSNEQENWNAFPYNPLTFPAEYYRLKDYPKRIFEKRLAIDKLETSLGYQRHWYGEEDLSVSKEVVEMKRLPELSLDLPHLALEGCF